MLTDLLIGWVVSGLAWLLGLFPTGTVTPFQSWGLVLNNLSALNYFLPITETFALVVGVLFVFPIFAGVSLAAWLIALIRGGSSRG